MDDGVIILATCGAYLLLSLLMGILPGRRVTKTVTGFVAADRTMSVVVLYFVIGASVFSSFAFLGGPGWAYSRGAAAFYILAYGAVGMVPLYFFGPRTWRLGERLGFVTQAELLSHRFDSRLLSVILAALSVAAFVPYLTLQMKGAGYILETVSGGLVPLWLGALVTYGVVLTYVFTSGVLGVGWTNMLQGMFMMAIAWFLGLYLPAKLYGGVGAMFEAIEAGENGAMLRAPGLDASGEPWSWGAYSSAVIVSAVGFTMWPHLFMKSFAADRPRTVRLTAVLFPTFQLFLVPILLIGFAGVVAFPGVSPADTIVPYLLTQLDLSPLLVGLVCAGALAASMSSGDAILHAAASIGVRDGVGRVVAMSDRMQRRWIRSSVILLGALGYYFAVVSDVSIVALLLGAYGGVAQIFPLVFSAFYWPRATRAGVLAGLIGGLAVNTLFLTAPELRPFPLHEGVYGLVVNVCLLIGVSFATSPPAEDRIRPYLESGSSQPKRVQIPS